MHYGLYCIHNWVVYKCMIWNYSISNRLHQWAIDVHNYALNWINSSKDINISESLYMQRVTVVLSGPSHEKIQLIYLKKLVIFQNNQSTLKELYGANNHVYSLNILCETWLHVYPLGQEHRQDFWKDQHHFWRRIISQITSGEKEKIGIAVQMLMCPGCQALWLMTSETCQQPEICYAGP